MGHICEVVGGVYPLYQTLLLLYIDICTHLQFKITMHALMRAYELVFIQPKRIKCECKVCECWDWDLVYPCFNSYTL